MILGAEPRNRPVVRCTHRGTHATRLDQGEHRDRGRFLTPRLYPTAPFDPWQPVSSYRPHAMTAEEVYALARESM